MATSRWNSFWALSGNQKDIPDDFGYSDAPKLKFLSTVSIGSRISIPEIGTDSMETNKFALKQATRPNINITYADANFYGYRSKVATRTDYGVVTLTFYDDNKNKAHTFFKNYLNNVSPISNSTKENAGSLEFTRPPTIGPMVDTHGPISYIRVSHHYHPSNILGDSAKVTHYDYLNPKMQNVILDELDMTQSDSSTVTLTFVYDSVNIVEE